jgi:hypothetical protein
MREAPEAMSAISCGRTKDNGVKIDMECEIIDVVKNRKE